MRLTVTPLQITFVMLAFQSISEHGGVRFFQISYQLRVACYPLTTPDEFFWQLKFACITFCLYRNFIYSVCITRINLIFRANQLLLSYILFRLQYKQLRHGEDCRPNGYWFFESSHKNVMNRYFWSLLQHAAVLNL